MNYLMWLFECDQIVAVQSGWALNPFSGFLIGFVNCAPQAVFSACFQACVFVGRSTIDDDNKGET